VKGVNGRRLLWVGLASILPTASGELLMDSPGYPQAYRPFSLAHAAAIEVFNSSDLDWVSIAPSGDFDHENPGRVGSYRLAPADAALRISYADLAIAVLDEIDDPRHHRTLLGVSGGTMTG
jgi:putative NADH-flavin reductase